MYIKFHKTQKQCTSQNLIKMKKRLTKMVKCMFAKFLAKMLAWLFRCIYTFFSFQLDANFFH